MNSHNFSLGVETILDVKKAIVTLFITSMPLVTKYLFIEISNYVSRKGT